MSQGNVYEYKHFKQTADINLGGHEWYPIGKPTGFYGIYDGNNYEIEGVWIENFNSTTAGLFGYVANAVLRNITLTNPQIKNSIVHTAGIVGAADSTFIENCHVKGGCITGAEYTAGIHGGATNTVIRNCTNSAKIYGNAAGKSICVGGIVGWQGGDDSLIENCVNYGNVESLARAVGGIVGEMAAKGKIINSHNYGNVKGTNDVGGIAGKTFGCVEKCTASCIVEATGDSWYWSGGIVGVAGESVATIIKDCVANVRRISAVSALNQSGAILGGLAGGSTTTAVIENCSFYGSSNVNGLSFYGTEPMETSANSITVKNSYAVINQDKYYSDGDFRGFALEAGFNKGLPAQKALYWAMGVAPEFSVSWFSENNFRKVA